MDNKAMFSISYGLYVLTARGGNFQNGCIINTLQQVTSTPNRVSITFSKANYTNYLMFGRKGKKSIWNNKLKCSLFTTFRSKKSA